MIPVLSQEELNRFAHLVLENPFWIDQLEVDMPYERTHDDTDGKPIMAKFLSHSEKALMHWFRSTESMV